MHHHDQFFWRVLNTDARSLCSLDTFQIESSLQIPPLFLRQGLNSVTQARLELTTVLIPQPPIHTGVKSISLLGKATNCNAAASTPCQLVLPMAGLSSLHPQRTRGCVFSLACTPFPALYSPLLPTPTDSLGHTVPLSLRSFYLTRAFLCPRLFKLVCPQTRSVGDTLPLLQWR